MDAYFYRSPHEIKSIFGCCVKEQGDIVIESDITDGANEINSSEEFDDLVTRYVQMGDYIIILWNGTYIIFECID